MKDAAMSLLDPRFNYVPSVATDIRATWLRFGFNPRANEERRRRVSPVTQSQRSDTPPIRSLVIVKA
jgi:hypothetical protein